MHLHKVLLQLVLAFHEHLEQLPFFHRARDIERTRLSQGNKFRAAVEVGQNLDSVNSSKLDCEYKGRVSTNV